MNHNHVPVPDTVYFAQLRRALVVRDHGPGLAQEIDRRAAWQELRGLTPRRAGTVSLSARALVLRMAATGQPRPADTSPRRDRLRSQLQGLPTGDDAA
jgi:hypothetical protein